MKFVLPLLFTLSIAFLLAAPLQTAAKGYASGASSKQKVMVKNVHQAAQIARNRYGGKVLKVKAQKSGYRVKLIKDNGHIISVVVNAKSGKISGQ